MSSIIKIKRKYVNITNYENLNRRCNIANGMGKHKSER